MQGIELDQKNELTGAIDERLKNREWLTII